MDFSKGSNNTGKLMVLIGSVVAIVGCFLPFASISILGFSESISFIEGDGVFVLVLSIVSIILAFFKTKLCWIANGLALLVTLYDCFNIATEMSISLLSFGAYAIIIASIVAIVGSFKS